MTLHTLLCDYATFNRWANSRLTDWLMAAPADLMHCEVASSFPSLHLTMLHLWAAEHLWLERLQGLSPAAFLYNTFQGSTAELVAGWHHTSQAFEKYVHALTEQALQGEQSFHLLNGQADTQGRAHMIHHCFNHATYHRGQLVTIGRSLGLSDPPATDFIAFLRNR